jgi:hypothetical protein
MDQSQTRNLNSRLRAGILLTMAIATIYGGAICFAGAAYCVDEYWRSVTAEMSWLSHAKALPLHVLSFIYPALGMYLSIMVLLVGWYCYVRPVQSPVVRANLECPADQIAAPGR